MISYCLKCKKYRESKNPRGTKTNKAKIILVSRCVVCNAKKQRFIRKQRTSGLLNKLAIKPPLSKKQM